MSVAVYKEKNSLRHDDIVSNTGIKTNAVIAKIAVVLISLRVVWPCESFIPWPVCVMLCYIQTPADPESVYNWCTRPK